MAVTLAQVMEAVEASGAQDRTVVKLREVASGLASGLTVSAACGAADVGRSAYHQWRGRWPIFAQFADQHTKARAKAKVAHSAAERVARAKDAGLVFDPDAAVPPAPDLRSFRWDYFGQPTEPHQEAAIAALEDMSNRVVIILGPTGMGKDTIAGQYLLWRLVPTRQGLRGAWFMASEDQSRKRLRRLSRYLVDPAAYRRKPEFTPGGQIPTRSLIDDWGPFRWEAGMVHADGRKVEREPWTAHAMYFLQDVAPEQDPNLWATGVQGETYGARIQEAVCSDIFTNENQESPTERKRSLEWILGTLDTRLDELGRLVVIGTNLPKANNYEEMIDKYTAGARVLRTQQMGPGTYTKYSNGTAVVVVKAIVVDENGDEQTYWDRFPLESHLEIRRHKQVIRVPAESVSDSERLRMADDGVDVKWVEGLLDRRRRDPRIFKAMFQQERDADQSGDFTAATLEAALDASRTYEVAYPNELVTVGVDPGKHYGGAYSALAVDRTNRTITLVDEFWATRLGDSGIRSKLVQAPIVKWSPIWFCYEVNRHSMVLSEDLTVQLFREFGVSLYEHKTSGKNRADHEIGVGSIATYMRAGVFRLPAMTASDRERSQRVWDHFLAFDESTLSDGRRRPGDANRKPDDLAFAIWPAFIKARVILEKDNRQATPPGMPVPAGVRQKWDRARKVAEARAAGKDPRRVDMTEGRNASLIDTMMAFVDA